MPISFSGLASGLDTSSWVEALVSIKKQKVTAFETDLSNQKSVKSTLTTMRGKVSDLRSALEKITDAKFGGSFDLFNKNSVTSGNEKVFTASVTANARTQNYDIGVEQLATYTKATSKEAASQVADLSTKLSEIGITSGDFTVYLNGIKNTINIEEDATFGDLQTSLNAVGVNMSIETDGKIQIAGMSGEDKLSFGTTTDTSNFVSLTGLHKTGDNTAESEISLYKAGVSSKLTNENAGFNTQITEGTFKIGNAEFTIDENTTLSSLISQINSNEDAQAYAHWDNTSGKLSITSKVEGASFINIEAGTSNFTDVMNLTNGSQMYTEAQELGKNAIFTVNGTRYTSTSNTVTSDISRIEGLTLNLHSVSSEDEPTTRLEIAQDTSGLTDAIKTFVSSYNNLIKEIDSVTASGQDLHGESALTGLKSTLRSYANGSNANGGIYTTLAQLGISVSGANANDLSADVTSLSFDESKLLEALAEDPDSVKAILAGENGVFNMMEETVERSLAAGSGYFDIKNSTIDSDITKIESKIKTQNSRIETYRAQLEKKFKAMEQMITAMQQNYSSFLS